MVKITFKTVQNKLFTIDAEDSESIGAIKKKIQETQTFPAENQKLIYSGKILADTATIGSLGFKEKDFIVVMVSKPKAAPAPKVVETPTPAPAAPELAAAPAAESAPATSTEETPASAAAPAATEAAAPTESAGSSHPTSFLAGPALQQAIESMVEMGFPRDQVQRALRASFNNPDRAVEYLFSGNIPEVEEEAPAPRAPANPPAAATPAPATAETTTPAPAPAAAPAPSAPATQNAGSADNLFAAAEAAMNRDRGVPSGGAAPSAAAGAGGAGALGALGGLANSPQMQEIREMVQQNPALIQPLLQQIAASNPALAQMINQNPEALYELLGAALTGEGGDEDEDMGAGQQVMHVNLTQDEAAAVERLEALGFERQMVLQAYMLCDKNEELAANFLFDQGEDD